MSFVFQADSVVSDKQIEDVLEGVINKPDSPVASKNELKNKYDDVIIESNTLTFKANGVEKKSIELPINSGSGGGSVKPVIPEIGDDGNWYVNNINTGKPSRGEQGINGNNGIDGITPNIQIGTVTTLPPNSTATVTRKGTNENPIFDFGIPQGQKGADGIGEGSGSNILVEDNLTSTSTANALSANQGRVLDNKITVLSDEVQSHLNNHPNGEGGNGILKIVSPSGIEFVLKVRNNGELYTEKVEVPLPDNFPTFTFTGKATYQGEFYIALHDEQYPYVIQMNHNGDVLWYKKLNNFAYNFRKYTSKSGATRYCYQEVIVESSVAKADGGHDTAELVVLDEKKIEIDRIRMITNKSVKPLQPNECHDYIYIDDRHYIVSGYIRDITSQWEGKGENYTITNSILQEIKNNELLWHWESKEHLDLFGDSQNDALTGDAGADYCHFNSIVIDSNDNNFICSFRNLHSIVKISRTTGEIMWKLGGKSDMFNVPSDKVWIGQHDCKIISSENGIINMTFYDNHTGHLTDGNLKSFIVDITINEKTKEIVKLNKYSFGNKVGSYMGGVTKIGKHKNRYSVNWGMDNHNIAQEIDFDLNKEIFSISCTESDCYRVFRTIDFIPDDDVENVEPSEKIIEVGNMISGAWDNTIPPRHVNASDEIKCENGYLPITPGKTYRVVVNDSSISSNLNFITYNSTKSKVISNSEINGEEGFYIPNMNGGQFEFKAHTSSDMSFFNFRLMVSTQGLTYTLYQLD